MFVWLFVYLSDTFVFVCCFSGGFPFCLCVCALVWVLLFVNLFVWLLRNSFFGVGVCLYASLVARDLLVGLVVCLFVCLLV